MAKKYLRAACLLLVISGISLCALKMQNVTAEASASAEITMELTTGTVLESENAEKQLPMASTTKIMTALIIAEDCDLDEVITIPDEAVGVEGSSIYLKKDEEIDIRDLLYGLLLRSGNDAAEALAIHRAGSVEAFVELMNERARQIGAESTHFQNPSGLPAEGHYTTARDLCEIARTAMQNPVFKEAVGTKSYKGKFRNFSNKNKMLYNFEGANGVKTGYTTRAGRCLVSSAEREGMCILCVVLNCPDMYERSSCLLNNAFNNFELHKISENKVFMCGIVPCKLEKSVNFVTKCTQEINYRVIPLKSGEKTTKGEIVAELQIFDQKDLILKRDLYSI